MIYSFISSLSGQSDLRIQNNGMDKNPLSNGLSIFGWDFLFRVYRNADLQQAVSVDEVSAVIVIGQIYNHNYLNHIVAGDNKDFTLAETIKLILYENPKYIKYIEGAFTIIDINRDSKITLYSDGLGMMPCYFSKNHQVFSSEIKNFNCVSNFKYQFDSYERVLELEHVDNYCPVINLYKFSPGAKVTLLPKKTTNKETFSVEKYSNIGLTKVSNVKLNELEEPTYNYLDEIISDRKEDKEALIPLSGGIDSSIIATLASKHFPKLKTCSIGTSSSNEFKYAKLLANHIGSCHDELELSDSEVIKSVIHAIHHNEIYDGLSAEIQSPLVALYKYFEGSDKTIITGYGSDLIFGGVLNDEICLSNINEHLFQLIYRTRWTGEFSIFSAAEYGHKLVHPFWQSRLMQIVINSSPSFKRMDGIIKPILKNISKSKLNIPEKIINRKKIGIHEGSSINQIFSSYIKASPCDYKAKTIFSYNQFKKMLVRNSSPENFDYSSNLSMQKVS